MAKMITNDQYFDADWARFTLVDSLLQTPSTGNFCKCLHLANAFIHLCELAFNVSVSKTVKFWLQ